MFSSPGEGCGRGQIWPWGGYSCASPCTVCEKLYFIPSGRSVCPVNGMYPLPCGVGKRIAGPRSCELGKGNRPAPVIVRVCPRSDPIVSHKIIQSTIKYKIPFVQPNIGANSYAGQLVVIKCMPPYVSNVVRNCYAGQLVAPKCPISDVSHTVGNGDVGQIVALKCPRLNRSYPVSYGNACESIISKCPLSDSCNAVGKSNAGQLRASRIS